MNTNAVVIIGCARTPLGNFLGNLSSLSAPQLGGSAIAAAVARAGMDKTLINEVIMGCVLTAGVGQAPARQAAFFAGLPDSIPALTINKVCGSALKAIMLGNDLIVAHTAEYIVAGGMESMSNAPYLLPKARQGYRIQHQTALDHMLYDGLEDAYQRGKLMGSFAEDCAKNYNFSRAMQDQYTLQSVQWAQTAAQDGKFSEEITPINLINKAGNSITIDKDEGPQSVKVEKITQLKPVFEANGSVTAANSSSIADGAAACVLTTAENAQKNNYPILAKIIGHSTFAHAPKDFPTAPVGAIKLLCQKIAWQIEDVDLFEVNEAFAIVPMAVMHDLKIARDKINVNGGACVLGHPIGASGARILITLIYALKQRGLKRGIAALCLGGGEAVAMAIEV